MGATHRNQNANAVGVLDERYENKIVHFRGIKYGRIEKRFANPQLAPRSKATQLHALQYGPRCPQTPYDVRDLIQIPRNLKLYDRVGFDELECLNLNITAPTDAQPGSLPVVIWIHGGAQINSFPAADERLGDPGPLVAQSITSNKPFLLVTFNYRLNIFAYGDNNGPKNLHLQDCSVLCEWVRDNIHAFGGDSNNITLAGQSAGAILVHALLIIGTPGIKRAILGSGSLYGSLPKAPQMVQPILDRVIRRSREIEAEKGNPNASSLTLRDVSVPTLIQAQAESYITAMFFQEEPALSQSRLEDHSNTFKNVDLMLGDAEFESILWQAPSKIFPESAVISCFTGTNKPSQPIPPANAKLAETYLQNATVIDKRLGAVKSAALEFIMDDHLAYPNFKMSNHLRNNGGHVYQYIFEEVNPFAAASKRGIPRAHHAIDTLALFGAYEDDYPNHPSFKNFQHVSKKFRQSWIDFASGEAPWDGDKVYSFGPDGQVGELRSGEYKKKRRTEHFKVLEEVGIEVYDAVWRRIAATADVVIEKAMQIQKTQAAEAAKGKQHGSKI